MASIVHRAKPATVFRSREHIWALPGLLAILLAGLLSYPGTHFLTSDTQIWTVMMEHQLHPEYLGNDLLAQYPHIGLSFYDEIVNGVRRITGLGVFPVMYAHLVIFRMVMLVGAYLLGFALSGSRMLALWMTASIQMIYLIPGPTICVFEVEPVPRGFSLSLCILAVALFVLGKRWSAAWTLGLVMLFQAVTAYPVLLGLSGWIWFGGARSERMVRLRLLLPAVFLAVTVIGLSILAQGGSGGTFTVVPDWLVEVQRIRASYNWISSWSGSLIVVHVVYCLATAISYFRLGAVVNREAGWFLLGIPVVALCSVPVAWLMMEKLHLMLAAQAQPARALAMMYGIGVVMLLSAGVLAIRNRRWMEGAGWLVAGYGIVFLDRTILLARQLGMLAADIPFSWQWLWAVALALGAAVLLWAWERRPALAGALLCVWMAVPFGVYRIAFQENVFAQDARNPEVTALSVWAEDNTSRDAVFLFPGFGKSTQPGVFRSTARRAVYVDWKSGGQVNYDVEFSRLWWDRWQEVGTGRFDPRRAALYSARGIDYLVVAPKDAVAAIPVQFQNAAFVVYRTSDLLASRNTPAHP